MPTITAGVALVISLSPFVVVLSLYSLGLTPVVFTARSAACRALPPNIQADADLQPAIAQLLARSRTIRSQCLRIAASPATHVSVTISLSPIDAGARAGSMARRYESGLLVVEVQIPPASRDFAELLAHELEHVTELIDGVDFAAQASGRSGEVDQNRSDGSFESERARRAGILAAAEASADTDRGAAAIAHGLSDAWRAFCRFARSGFRR